VHATVPDLNRPRGVPGQAKGPLYLPSSRSSGPPLPGASDAPSTVRSGRPACRLRGGAACRRRIRQAPRDHSATGVLGGGSRRRVHKNRRPRRPPPPVRTIRYSVTGSGTPLSHDCRAPRREWPRQPDAGRLDQSGAARLCGFSRLARRHELQTLPFFTGTRLKRALGDRVDAWLYRRLRSATTVSAFQTL
jgi:hypothetical protein